MVVIQQIFVLVHCSCHIDVCSSALFLSFYQLFDAIQMGRHDVDAAVQSELWRCVVTVAPLPGRYSAKDTMHIFWKCIYIFTPQEEVMTSCIFILEQILTQTWRMEMRCQRKKWKRHQPIKRLILFRSVVWRKSQPYKHRDGPRWQPWSVRCLIISECQRGFDSLTNDI